MIADRDGHGDELLHDIRCMLGQRWLPPGWGMSISCHTDGETVVPYEVSFTQSPAFSDALVLIVGAESLRTYEALTGIELATALLAGGGRAGGSALGCWPYRLRLNQELDLTHVTTGPTTLGSGGSSAGFYQQIGDFMHAEFKVI